MFTGLVERVGHLERWEARGAGRRLHVRHTPWETPLARGESVCVQGACLTVEEAAGDTFAAAVLDETLRRTSLGGLPAGAALNLERALRPSDRLGGHFVTGHVDAVGRVASVRRDGEDRVVRIACDPDLLGALAPKGCIACDGVSLTLSALLEDAFEVCLIPVTWHETALRGLTAGSPVNLEADILGKYVRRFLERAGTGAPRVTEETLRRAGFL